MINLYEALSNFPGLSKQLHCKGLLFTNYDCPQIDRQERFYSECNYIEGGIKRQTDLSQEPANLDTE